MEKYILIYWLVCAVIFSVFVLILDPGKSKEFSGKVYALGLVLCPIMVPAMIVVIVLKVIKGVFYVNKNA